MAANIDIGAASGARQRSNKKDQQSRRSTISPAPNAGDPRGLEPIACVSPGCAIVNRPVPGDDALLQTKNRLRCRPQFFASPRQAGANGPYGRARDARRMLVAQALEADEKDGVALLFR